MRRTGLLLATMALAILLSCRMAQAIIKPNIINGEPDRGPKAHPYAGALVTKVQGQVQVFCSGTLISPKVFLTAGHCTEAVKGKLFPKGSPTYVTFDPTFEQGPSKLVKGTPYTHPKFCWPPPRLTIQTARPRQDYLGSPLISPAMMQE